MTLATSKNDFIISDKRYKKIQKRKQRNNNQKMPYEQWLGDSGKETPLFTGRNLQKDQA